MSLIHHADDLVVFKILYMGPTGSGKSTNLRVLNAQTYGEGQAHYVDLESCSGGTFFFDFLPLQVLNPQGQKVYFHLVTLPGHRFFPKLTERIIEGSDALVFVADSERDRMQTNIESLRASQDLLEKVGIDPFRLPTVFQYNKRDLEAIYSVAELNAALRYPHSTAFETIVQRGVGTLETIQHLANTMIEEHFLRPR